MDFLSLSRRRSSSRNVPSVEERGETDVFAGYAINNLQFFTGDGQFFTGVTSMLVLDEKWKWKMHVNSFLLKLVITKGYGVRATTIEGQNVPAFCFAYVSRDKWSKRA